MTIVEPCAYAYKGFGEGQYIHDFYLGNDLQEKVQPRDLLAIYRHLLGMGQNIALEKLKPSSLRTNPPDVSSLARSCKSLQRAGDLTIFYQQESLVKIISAETLVSVVSACVAYITDLAGSVLDDADTTSLCFLNERLRLLQKENRRKISALTRIICKFESMEAENCLSSDTYKTRCSNSFHKKKGRRFRGALCCNC